MSGVPIPPLEPGSPEWYKSMSASKIGTILGLNDRWDSPFHLWQLMAGKIQPPAQTADQARGHFLENGVAQWFASQHPDWAMTPGGCWAHADRSWQTASPDRRLYIDSPRVNSLLEVKTDGSWSAYDAWGASGSDDIPPRYRVQVMWQLDTLGLDHGWVAVLLPGLEFREYRINYDPDEALVYREAAKEFLDSITANVPPPLDGSEWTYRALKQLPDRMEDRSVEVGRDVADMLKAGAELAKGAEKIRQEAANLVLAAIGNGRRAHYVDGDGYRIPVATRAVKKDGTTHSLRVAPGLTVETTAA